MTETAALLLPAIRWDATHGFDHLRPEIDRALELGVGGFIFFGGPAEAVRDLARELHRRSRVPLLVSADLERGAGQQFDGLTGLPPLAAIASLGDVDALRSMLTDRVVLTSDGGAGRKAARHPIDGVERVVRFLASIGPRLFGAEAVPAGYGAGDPEVRFEPVNGQPGFVVLRGDQVVHAGTVEIADGAITSIWWVVNPDKLRWIATGS